MTFRLFLRYLLQWTVGLVFVASPLVKAQAPAPAQCSTVYAVHDKNVEDSQFFAYHLTQYTLQPLGPLHASYDIEGLSLHPLTNILYGSSGQPNAQLYTVDGITGQLSVIGEIGFDNVVALAFHPTDYSLWGWSDQGLLKINVITGAGTLISAAHLPIQDLAWNRDGTLLYAVANDNPTHSTLLVYNKTAGWQTVCDNLPKKVEGLEMRPDGFLVYGFDKDTQLGIHTYDINQCQTIEDAQIDTPYYDIEGIAWSTRNCLSSNLEALRTYFESLEGFEGIIIEETEGTISVTLDGKIYKSQLDPQVTSSTPPPNGLLVVEPINDVNEDGTEDYRITYPSGDQQILYNLGIEENCPESVISPVDVEMIAIPTLATLLYTGTDPVQTGLTPGVIEPDKVAILHGKVVTNDGEPLSEVTITVAHHLEFGQTVTDCNGIFNLAVNGEEELIINYQKAGYLPLQRRAIPYSQKYVPINEIILIPMTSQSTQIDLNANIPMQAVQNVVQNQLRSGSDNNKMLVTMLFPEENTANLMNSTNNEPGQPLGKVDVRITEYSAVPHENGKVPPKTTYFYVAEFTLDAEEKTAETDNTHFIQFTKPVSVYVDNFTDLPTGEIIPSGWYDYNKANWMTSENGSENGLVVKILRISEGLAVLDIDGSDNEASADSLKQLGITDPERQRLAEFYTAGKSLWRTPISRFSTTRGFGQKNFIRQFLNAKTIMWFAAHPDDEIVVAPLLGPLCNLPDKKCFFFFATRGEGSHCFTQECQNMPGWKELNDLLKRESSLSEEERIKLNGLQDDYKKWVADIRNSEMENNALFGPNAEFFAYNLPSSGKAYKPPEEVINDWIEVSGLERQQLYEFIRARLIDPDDSPDTSEVSPDIIITFDPSHGTGCHSAHRAIALLVWRAIMGGDIKKNQCECEENSQNSQCKVKSQWENEWENKLFVASSDRIVQFDPGQKIDNPKLAGFRTMSDPWNRNWSDDLTWVYDRNTYNGWDFAIKTAEAYPSQFNNKWVEVITKAEEYENRKVVLGQVKDYVCMDESERDKYDEHYTWRCKHHTNDPNFTEIGKCKREDYLSGECTP